jgi:hypothetical protein
VSPTAKQAVASVHAVKNVRKDQKNYMEDGVRLLKSMKSNFESKYHNVPVK